MFKTAYYMLLDSDLRESAIMSQGRPIPAKEAYVYTLYVLYVTCCNNVICNYQMVVVVHLLGVGGVRM